MSYADVCEAVESLQRKYCERDPFRLCADMGIKLLYQPLGTDPDAIKGFYLESKRIRTITVNCKGDKGKRNPYRQLQPAGRYPKDYRFA